ncbi:aconitate hydratase [Enhydrobacter sp.]|jgi:aconitate hydratase|uniref:aconitate hydratase n=1 Tax=Enhydrobacter sp. TaxID=1894999 RepID=UPI002616BC57|nr:aconitate hydratase [Enhydrobacter sp.]WIM13007.1 MAG: Aconitate hydratase [Enhydrobacter sp.]
MIDLRQRLDFPAAPSSTFHSLPLFEKKGIGRISRLPVSLRILLESVLRNLDGQRIREEDVETLAHWQPNADRTAEVPFIVGRVLLQDFTGVPLLVDLAAMRSAITRRGGDILRVQPVVPVDLVVDHSVQVDYFGRSDAVRLNMEIEFRRNSERYQFLKWGAQAFNNLRIVPPGFGICHQVNLEFLARGILEKDGTLYPDTLVGTDSHTTMINGLGVVGWGVGGIEAEAAMLGQPVYILLPDVVGVHLHGQLREGATATDLVLRITELLRQARVVGKFVEFHGEGAATLSVPDRATIGNMAPEYGATIGYFPVDEQSCRYLRVTGRSDSHVEAVRRYFQAQGLFGMPARGQCDYTSVLDVNLSEIEPSVAGPKRPQDRIALGQLKQKFLTLITDPDGYGRSEAELARSVPVQLGTMARPHPGGGTQSTETLPDGHETNTNTLTETEMVNNRPTPNRPGDAERLRAETLICELSHGDVVIAAITSCTNTSNPIVMLSAGLLAKKAVERGLSVKPWVKTSLAPGSRIVSEYLSKTGLQPFLDHLGFNLVGFGCTTCIGNSGPLDRQIEEALTKRDIIGASILSGNRNFEARIHQSVKANFLMSPPLVVAFAIAGRIDIDLTREPLAVIDGREVHLRDVWPTAEEIEALLGSAFDPVEYTKVYADYARQNSLWTQIPAAVGTAYEWNPASMYIREPPYFDPSMAATEPARFSAARALAIFDDSITTDHISPAGAIKPASPAGSYLRDHDIPVEDFNSYGARRGNHEVMVRGTFANVRIRNLMVPSVEGGFTSHQPSGERMSIYDAAERYRTEGVPLIVIAGQDYGAGSSRDWAAKGTRLLGVRAVIASGFERIHRSNLIGMGVLPCQFPEGVSARTLALDGTERFDLELEALPHPHQSAILHIERRDGLRESISLVVRIDTPIEAAYFSGRGILPFMLEQLLAQSTGHRGPPTRQPTKG